MSQWITDRIPTEQDADYLGMVWITNASGKVTQWLWNDVDEGVPWMTREFPKPFKQPRRDWFIAIDRNNFLDKQHPRGVHSQLVRVREVFEDDPDIDGVQEAIKRMLPFANNEMNMPWGDVQEILGLLTGQKTDA